MRFSGCFPDKDAFPCQCLVDDGMVLASLIPVDHHKVADCRIVRQIDCSMTHFTGYFRQQLRFSGRNPIQFLVLRDDSGWMQIRIKGRLLREPVRESQIC
ncbi:hypothetical protein SDC9_185499 [bioreactor metagenome]|uniref:Uncharacterized protein n=1 Tax=bioreactor metagenome TaxID=1076179 RepID=A0A645HG16_9ZZZZ